MNTLQRLVLFAACAIALGACNEAPRAVSAAPSRDRSVAAARIDTQERDAGWLGVVLPRQSIDLAPEIAGQVEQVFVHEGDTVRRGQAVAVLGAAHDRQELAMAGIGLRAAEADVSRSRLELADAENRLASRMSMPDAFPREEIRRAEIQKRMAEVNLEGSQARAEEQRTRMAQARDRLDKATLRAPADGIVTRRYVEAGSLAGPGQPVVRLISDGSLVVRFAAPPDQARSMRAAMRVGVSTEGMSVPAIIESVSSEIDPPSGMVILVAALDRVTAIKPGSVVRVHPA